MSEKYELSEFQKELEKADHLFSMYWTRKELKNRLDKIEQKDKYINSLLQYTNDLETQLQQKENIIKELREKVDNFDVFKEFTFPLMKRDEEQQVKSSIDYEWRKSIKEPILEILDKGE